MKYKMHFLIAVLIVCMVFPTTVYAKTYKMSDTDISINIDSTSWYVFTRDNLRNNPELDELGLTYDFMHSFLYDNMAYMDAMLFYEDGDFIELLIRKKVIENSFTNLSNYSSEQVLEVAKEFGKQHNTDKYSVYENQYKFIRLEYFDSSCDYYICEFFTMVNKENYTLTFQSMNPFAKQAYDEMQKIVDSIEFDIDPTMEELIPAEMRQSISFEEESSNNINQVVSSTLGNEAVELYITSAISGLGMATLAVILGKIKRAKNKKEEENVPDDIPELRKWWYEKDSIFVEFQSGQIAKYVGVPDRLYFAMCNAPKKSKYLFEHVNGKYQSVSVNEADKTTATQKTNTEKIINRKDNVPDNIPELKNAWYEKECLFAEFQSGRVMKYLNVPDKMYFAMCQAQKKSKYLFEHIVGNYEAVQITPTPQEDISSMQTVTQESQKLDAVQKQLAIESQSHTYPQPKNQQELVTEITITDKFEEIKKYKELLDIGVLTQEEFDTKKKELLNL